jgi:hypothetical protein
MRVLSLFNSAALLGLLSLLGCLGGEGPPPKPAECPAPSAADLARLCEAAPTTQDAVKRADEAQGRVDKLRAAMEQANEALTRLEADSKVATKRDEANERKKKELTAQLADLQSQMSSAEGERDAARAELETALERLDVAVAATEKAEAEAELQRARASGNGWQAFTAETQLALCDRGTRRRHARCHEAVTAALAAFEPRYKGCVDRGQATPELRELSAGAEVPAFAERLPEDSKYTRGDWIVVFCDPTLPEQPTPPVPPN